MPKTILEKELRKQQIGFCLVEELQFFNRPETMQNSAMICLLFSPPIRTQMSLL